MNINININKFYKIMIILYFIFFVLKNKAIGQIFKRNNLNMFFSDCHGIVSEDIISILTDKEFGINGNYIIQKKLPYYEKMIEQEYTKYIKDVNIPYPTNNECFLNDIENVFEKKKRY